LVLPNGPASEYQPGPNLLNFFSSPKSNPCCRPPGRALSKTCGIAAHEPVLRTVQTGYRTTCQDQKQSLGSSRLWATFVTAFPNLPGSQEEAKGRSLGSTVPPSRRVNELRRPLPWTQPGRDSTEEGGGEARLHSLRSRLPGGDSCAAFYDRIESNPYKSMKKLRALVQVSIQKQKTAAKQGAPILFQIVCCVVCPFCMGTTHAHK
ncbi:uncharacterized protein LOC112541659, partial [Python bivittatus]|uniref:Uncharacterized protein LOC112541659 n=1 Tax=Python bivittatus TaxID=176946 RepID=A0A9F5J5W4_PYTBI